MPISLLLMPTAVGMISGPPVPGFQIEASLAMSSGDPAAALLALSYEIRTADGIRVQPDSACPVAQLQPHLAPNQPLRIALPVTFTRDVLDAIEEKRAGKGEVVFNIAAHALVAPVRGEGLGKVEKIAVQVRNLEGHMHRHLISRDAWLSYLGAFKYSEVEVFELPKLHLGRHVDPEALRLVMEAAADFREGDWDGTLTKSYRAYETIAKTAGETSNVRAGFERLWEGLLPQPQDKPKRDALDEVVRGLKEFDHLGRHSNYPTLRADRTDALLALRTTLAVFAYIGARAEAKR